MPLVLSTFQQHTLILKLNRPDKANAFNRDMIFELRNALDEAEKNDDVRAILLIGEGKTFSSGQDITEMLAAREQEVSYLEH